jgi:hypothetical protein
VFIELSSGALMPADDLSNFSRHGLKAGPERRFEPPVFFRYNIRVGADLHSTIDVEDEIVASLRDETIDSIDRLLKQRFRDSNEDEQSVVIQPPCDLELEQTLSRVGAVLFCDGWGRGCSTPRWQQYAASA